MKIQQCFDKYWDCAEDTCNSASKEQAQVMRCFALAGRNDLTYSSVKKRLFPVSLKSGDLCQRFRDLQNMACDCVPAAELDSRLESRVEQFFGDHDNSQLTKKGKLKDKKLWKKWKGKRPAMYFDLLMQYRKVAVQLFSSKGEPVSWDAEVKGSDKAG